MNRFIAEFNLVRIGIACKEISFYIHTQLAACNLVRIGIACKEISFYIHTQLADGLLLKMLKYFKVMSNIFEFSHVKEIVKS